MVLLYDVLGYLLSPMLECSFEVFSKIGVVWVFMEATLGKIELSVGGLQVQDSAVSAAHAVNGRNDVACVGVMWAEDF